MSQAGDRSRNSIDGEPAGSSKRKGYIAPDEDKPVANSRSRGDIASGESKTVEKSRRLTGNRRCTEKRASD